MDDPTLPNCEPTCDEMDPTSKEFFENCCADFDPTSTIYLDNCCAGDPSLPGCCANDPLLPGCGCTLSPLPEDMKELCCELLPETP